MKLVKKGISIILTFSVLLSVFVICTAGTAAALNTTEGIVLYFKNALEWEGNIFAVCGNEKYLAKVSSEKDEVYSFELPQESGNIHIENGAATQKTISFTPEHSGQIFVPSITNKQTISGVVVYGGTFEQYEVNNVIFMIGDGMGSEHIKAGGIYLGKAMEMTNMPYNTMVTTHSLDGLTDSAAAATAMATGYKTTNKRIGMLENETKVETLCEFAQKRDMKTGVIATQVLTHATPAGFTAHVPGRYSYKNIALHQLRGQFDLLLGGGEKYFLNEKAEKTIQNNNYVKVTDVNDINNVPNDKNVLGLFAKDYISADDTVKLADMTKQGLERLSNENGFFTMIEGSDIDSKAHLNEMKNMLKELEVFNNAIKVAREYVEENPDTLLIVTADHETGDLKIPANATRDSLLSAGDSYFSSKAHTGVNIPLYADGARANELCRKTTIDNTDIYDFIAKVLNDSHGKEVKKEFINDRFTI